MAGLSDPDCIRFMSKENINTLQSIRDFAEQLMNGFRRIADEHPDGFVGLEPVPQTLMICAAGDMAGAEAMCRVTEASWAINTCAYPDQDVRTRKVRECLETYLNMLQEFREHPGQTRFAIRASLHELVESRGAGYAYVVVGYGFLARTNCATTLERAVQAPRLWLHMVAHPEGETFVA